MIGAGLLLPLAAPVQAKTSYKYHKAKKYKASRKFKVKKYKHNKRFKVPKVKHRSVKRH